jgi:hypothetical protein
MTRSGEHSGDLRGEAFLFYFRQFTGTAF